ncbi:zinc finger MYM-type protein 1-like protein [Tanacetum coccineum]
MNTKRGGTLDWFVQKKRKNVDGSSSHLPSKTSTDLPSTEKECQFNVKSLLHDPGLRTSILDYHPNLQDEIRREYISKGLCRPAHDFPQTNFGGKMRRFRYEWYQKYSWLEYSISKDSAFCYVCYLFNVKDFNGIGGDAFVRNGFKGWNRPVGFTKLVGKVNSVHNQAREKYESLMKPKTSIQNLFDQQSAKYIRKYQTRLLASLHCIRLLLHQGLSTRGKKEGLISNNKGNFLELL